MVVRGKIKTKDQKGTYLGYSWAIQTDYEEDNIVTWVFIFNPNGIRINYKYDTRHPTEVDVKRFIDGLQR
jgi:hypothetical protein